MLRSLIITLFTITLSIPAVSVIAQEKPKTSTEAKPQTKPVSTSETPKVDPANKEKEKDKGETEEEANLLRQRGLFLLRQTGDEASNISDGRSAAQIQSKAADLLWDHDRETARKYFESAFDLAVRYYRDEKAGDKTDGKRPNFVTHGDARMEVITTVSRRDSALGRKFTDQYLAEKKREQDNALQGKTASTSNDQFFGKIDSTANDLLSTSTSLYESDPSASIDLALRAFSSGVPTSAPNFLASLAGRDRAAADRVFSYALNKIVGDESVPPGQLLLLSAYPFDEGQVWVSDGGNTSSWGFGAPKNFTVESTQIQQFFAASVAVLNRTAALNPAISTEAGSRIATALFMARLLQPKINQFQPALGEEWNALTGRLATASSEDTRNNVDSSVQGIERQKAPASDATNGNRITDLLMKAEDATAPGMKDVYYQQAAVEIDRTGETDRALLVADKISDREFRDKTKSWIYFEAATRAINDKHYDDARRYASMVDVVDQSAFLYIQVATAAVKDKDRARAAEMLDESLKRTSSAEDSMEKLRALLGIANVYSTFDTLRGFEVAAEAVRTANKLPDYNSEQDYLIRDISGKDRARMVSMSMVENFDIGRTLTVLGRSDFERSLLLAQSLENKAMRFTSVIAVAASVIESKKRP